MEIAIDVAIKYGILIGGVIFVIYTNKNAIKYIENKLKEQDKKIEMLESRKSTHNTNLAEIKICLEYINNDLKTIKEKLNII